MSEFTKNSCSRIERIFFGFLFFAMPFQLLAVDMEAVVDPNHDLYLYGTAAVILLLLAWLFILIRKNKKLSSLNQVNIDHQNKDQEEKTRLNERISSQEDQLKELGLKAGIVDLTLNSILITDATGKLEWANKSFEKLYGYKLSDLIQEEGDNIHTISTNPRAISEGIEHKKSVSYPSYRIHKNGKRVWLQVEFTPVVNEQGAITKFIFIETDVSLYKVTEEEIVQQREEIDYQLTIAEMQRDKMSSKYKIFTDSINYALRIQNAILPSKDMLKRVLDEYFILYKPRDIVSGDFYWVSEIDGKKVIAIADCTGHGVPGAFMSILGITFLSEIVSQSKHLRANKILNELRSIVLDSLSQSQKEDEAKDGIDMTLVIIDPTTMRLQFAGANNPLYLVRERHIKEIKGDRMPIGTHPNEDQPFTNHEIDIIPGDSLYMFTDGYADQFGWRNGKKFKYQAFRRLILDMYDIPMRGQRVIMDNTINNWRSDLEQVDDILVMGLQIK